MSSRGDRIRPGTRGERTAVRTVCLRRVPAHKKGRQTRLKALAEETRTTVLYESPHRIVKLLSELVEHCGPDRRVSVSRELSKKFEETRRGTAQELHTHFEAHAPKGEFVVVVAGAD